MVIQSKIVTTFGGLNDDPHQALRDVRRVLRLPGGEFVVVNGKPLDLRLFDASGRYLRSFGRAGSGPGEFRYNADVHPGTGDTVLTLAAVDRRWMEFDFVGRLLREYPMEQGPALIGGVTLTGGYFVRHHLPGSRGCAYPKLAGLPLPRSPMPREVLTDASGRLWVSDAEQSGQWQVTDPGSSTVHMVQLPAGFRVEQFSSDQLVGLTMDENNADHVMMLSVPLPPLPAARPRCDPPPKVDLPIFEELKTHARNGATTMEAVRRDLGRYPESADPVLKYLKLVDDTAFTLLVSGADGWGFEVMDRPSGARCVMSMGRHGIPGWDSGHLVCWAPHSAP